MHYYTHHTNDWQGESETYGTCSLHLFYQRQCELLPSLGVRRLSFVNFSHFNLLLWNLSGQMNWNLLGSIYGRSSLKLLILSQSINKHGDHRQFFFLIGQFLPLLAIRPCELLSSLFVRRPFVNISHFNLLLRNHWTNCNQTLVEWSLDGPFQNCVRWSRLSTKMATKLKIEKRGDEILIVHCCFSVSQNELKF